MHPFPALSSDQLTLLALVAAAPPSAATARFETFIRTEPACLERSTAAGHLTASAAVVDPPRRHLLLIHHRKLGRWLQPGGHADGQLDLAAVALREVAEETGLGRCRLVDPHPIDLDVHEIPAHGGVPAHLHYDVRFMIEADPLEPLAHDVEEVHAARWFGRDELLAGAVATDDAVIRLLERCGIG